MVIPLIYDIPSDKLKKTIGILEDTKSNLQSSLMQYENMSDVLVRIVFWRTKRDLINRTRMQIQFIEWELYHLRTKLFINEKRARTTQS